MLRYQLIWRPSRRTGSNVPLSSPACSICANDDGTKFGQNPRAIITSWKIYFFGLDKSAYNVYIALLRSIPLLLPLSQYVAAIETQRSVSSKSCRPIVLSKINSRRCDSRRLLLKQIGRTFSLRADCFPAPHPAAYDPASPLRSSQTGAFHESVYRRNGTHQ